MKTKKAKSVQSSGLDVVADFGVRIAALDKFYGHHGSLVVGARRVAYASIAAEVLYLAISNRPVRPLTIIKWTLSQMERHAQQINPVLSKEFIKGR